MPNTLSLSQLTESRQLSAHNEISFQNGGALSDKLEGTAPEGRNQLGLVVPRDTLEDRIIRGCNLAAFQHDIIRVHVRFSPYEFKFSDQAMFINEVSGVSDVQKAEALMETFQAARP